MPISNTCQKVDYNMEIVDDWTPVGNIPGHTDQCVSVGDFSGGNGYKYELYTVTSDDELWSNTAAFAQYPMDTIELTEITIWRRLKCLRDFEYTYHSCESPYDYPSAGSCRSACVTYDGNKVGCGWELVDGEYVCCNTLPGGTGNCPGNAFPNTCDNPETETLYFFADEWEYQWGALEGMSDAVMLAHLLNDDVYGCTNELADNYDPDACFMDDNIQTTCTGIEYDCNGDISSGLDCSSLLSNTPGCAFIDVCGACVGGATNFYEGEIDDCGNCTSPYGMHPTAWYEDLHYNKCVNINALEDGWYESGICITTIPLIEEDGYLPADCPNLDMEGAPISNQQEVCNENPDLHWVSSILVEYNPSSMGFGRIDECGICYPANPAQHYVPTMYYYDSDLGEWVGYDASDVTMGQVDDCGICYSYNPTHPTALMQQENANDLGCGCFEAAPMTYNLNQSMGCAQIYTDYHNGEIGGGSISEICSYTLNENNMFCLNYGHNTSGDGEYAAPILPQPVYQPTNWILCDHNVVEDSYGYHTEALSVICDATISDDPIGGTLTTGCTDENAFNYTPEANIDDGSCDYGNYGQDDVIFKFDLFNNLPHTKERLGIWGTHYDIKVQIIDPNGTDHLLNAVCAPKEEIQEAPVTFGVTYPTFGMLPEFIRPPNDSPAYGLQIGASTGTGLNQIEDTSEADGGYLSTVENFALWYCDQYDGYYKNHITDCWAFNEDYFVDPLAECGGGGGLNYFENTDPYQMAWYNEFTNSFDNWCPEDQCHMRVDCCSPGVLYILRRLNCERMTYEYIPEDMETATECRIVATGDDVDLILDHLQQEKLLQYRYVIDTGGNTIYENTSRFMYIKDDKPSFSEKTKDYFHNYEIPFESSNLPIIHYDNNTFKVINNKSPKLNSINDWQTTAVNGSMINHDHIGEQISYTFTSHGYKDLFNNGRWNREWELRPLNRDESFIREDLMYDLYSMVSDFSIQTTHVELLIDNEYKGTYLLKEKIGEYFNPPILNSFLNLAEPAPTRGPDMCLDPNALTCESHGYLCNKCQQYWEVCSDNDYDNQVDCESNSGIWYTQTCVGFYNEYGRESIYDDYPHDCTDDNGEKRYYCIETGQCYSGIDPVDDCTGEETVDCDYSCCVYSEQDYAINSIDQYAFISRFVENNCDGCFTINENIEQGYPSYYFEEILSASGEDEKIRLNDIWHNLFIGGLGYQTTLLKFDSLYKPYDEYFDFESAFEDYYAFGQNDCIDFPMEIPEPNCIQFGGDQGENIHNTSHVFEYPVAWQGMPIHCRPTSGVVAESNGYNSSIPSIKSYSVGSGDDGSLFPEQEGNEDYAKFDIISWENNQAGYSNNPPKGVFSPLMFSPLRCPAEGILWNNDCAGIYDQNICENDEDLIWNDQSLCQWVNNECIPTDVRPTYCWANLELDGEEKSTLPSLYRVDIYKPRYKCGVSYPPTFDGSYSDVNYCESQDCMEAAAEFEPTEGLPGGGECSNPDGNESFEVCDSLGGTWNYFWDDLKTCQEFVELDQSVGCQNPANTFDVGYIDNEEDCVAAGYEWEEPHQWGEHICGRTIPDEGNVGEGAVQCWLGDSEYKGVYKCTKSAHEANPEDIQPHQCLGDNNEGLIYGWEDNPNYQLNSTDAIWKWFNQDMCCIEWDVVDEFGNHVEEEVEIKSNRIYNVMTYGEKVAPVDARHCDMGVGRESNRFYMYYYGTGQSMDPADIDVDSFLDVFLFSEFAYKRNSNLTDYFDNLYFYSLSQEDKLKLIFDFDFDWSMGCYGQDWESSWEQYYDYNDYGNQCKGQHYPDRRDSTGRNGLWSRWKYMYDVNYKNYYDNPEYHATSYFWFDKLIEIDSEQGFDRLLARWNELRVEGGVFDLEKIKNRIETKDAYLTQAKINNFNRWPKVNRLQNQVNTDQLMTTTVGVNNDECGGTCNTDQLLCWIENRIKWIDHNIRLLKNHVLSNAQDGQGSFCTDCIWSDYGCLDNSKDSINYCNDPLATNYNEFANFNDGDCHYGLSRYQFVLNLSEVDFPPTVDATLRISHVNGQNLHVNFPMEYIGNSRWSVYVSSDYIHVGDVVTYHFVREYKNIFEVDKELPAVPPVQFPLLINTRGQSQFIDSIEKERDKERTVFISDEKIKVFDHYFNDFNLFVKNTKYPIIRLDIQEKSEIGDHGVGNLHIHYSGENNTNNLDDIPQSNIKLESITIDDFPENNSFKKTYNLRFKDSAQSILCDDIIWRDGVNYGNSCYFDYSKEFVLDGISDDPSLLREILSKEIWKGMDHGSNNPYLQTDYVIVELFINYKSYEDLLTQSENQNGSSRHPGHSHSSDSTNVGFYQGLYILKPKVSKDGVFFGQSNSGATITAAIAEEFTQETDYIVWVPDTDCNCNYNPIKFKKVLGSSFTINDLMTSGLYYPDIKNYFVLSIIAGDNEFAYRNFNLTRFTNDNNSKIIGFNSYSRHLGSSWEKSYLELEYIINFDSIGTHDVGGPSRDISAVFHNLMLSENQQRILSKRYRCYYNKDIDYTWTETNCGTIQDSSMGVINPKNIFSIIDKFSLELTDNGIVNREFDRYNHSGTFDQQIRFLKTWILNRLYVLDNEFLTLWPDTIPKEFGKMVIYSPINNDILDIEAISENIKIQFYDETTGQLIIPRQLRVVDKVTNAIVYSSYDIFIEEEGIYYYFNIPISELDTGSYSISISYGIDIGGCDDPLGNYFNESDCYCGDDPTFQYSWDRNGCGGVGCCLGGPQGDWGECEGEDVDEYDYYEDCVTNDGTWIPEVTGYEWKDEFRNISSNTVDVILTDIPLDRGCTDILAVNYDSSALLDDGSCKYESHCVGKYSTLSVSRYENIPLNIGANTVSYPMDPTFFGENADFFASLNASFVANINEICPAAHGEVVQTDAQFCNGDSVLLLRGAGEEAISSTFLNGEWVLSNDFGLDINKYITSGMGFILNLQRSGAIFWTPSKTVEIGF